MIEQPGRGEHLAYPVANPLVCSPVRASVEEQIITALFKAAFDRFFTVGWPVDSQAAVRFITNFRQYPDIDFINKRAIPEVIIKRMDFQLVIVIAGDSVRPGADRMAGEVGHRVPLLRQDHGGYMPHQPGQPVVRL